MTSYPDAKPPLNAWGDENPIMQGSQIMALLPQTHADKVTNSHILESEKLAKAQIHSLYPVSALYPVDNQFPAQQLMEQHKLALNGFKENNLPKVSPLNLPTTAFTQSVFDQTMKMFKANYHDLDGWQDAVRLAIKYTASEFTKLVESRSLEVNNDVFGVGHAEWSDVKKLAGMDMIP